MLDLSVRMYNIEQQALIPYPILSCKIAADYSASLYI